MAIILVCAILGLLLIGGGLFLILSAFAAAFSSPTGIVPSSVKVAFYGGCIALSLGLAVAGAGIATLFAG